MRTDPPCASLRAAEAPVQSWIVRGFALIALAGVIAYVAWPVGQQPSPVPTASAATTQAEDDNARELARVRGRVDRLEAEVLSLHTRLEDVLRAQASDGGVPEAPVAARRPSQALRKWNDALRQMRASQGGPLLAPRAGRASSEASQEEGAAWDPGQTGSAMGSGTGLEAGAEGAGRGGKRKGVQWNRFARRAQLSESQSSTLQSALQQERSQLKALRESQTPGSTSDALREQARALRQETDRQMKAVLDDGQYAQYQKTRTQSSHRNGRIGRTTGTGRATGMRGTRARPGTRRAR